MLRFLSNRWAFDRPLFAFGARTYPLHVLKRQHLLLDWLSIDIGLTLNSAGHVVRARPILSLFHACAQSNEPIFLHWATLKWTRISRFIWRSAIGSFIWHLFGRSILVYFTDLELVNFLATVVIRFKNTESNPVKIWWAWLVLFKDLRIFRCDPSF